MVLRNALLWLLEVDTCVTLVRSSPRGMVMTHEQLADDAYTHAQALFSHLEITDGEHTASFIDRLYHVSVGGPRGPRRTGMGQQVLQRVSQPQGREGLVEE